MAARRLTIQKLEKKMSELELMQEFYVKQRVWFTRRLENAREQRVAGPLHLAAIAAYIEYIENDLDALDDEHARVRSLWEETNQKLALCFGNTKDLNKEILVASKVSHGPRLVLVKKEGVG